MTEPEDEIERIRRLHGDKAANIAARFIAAPRKPKAFHRNTRLVGKRPTHPKPIPTSHSTNPSWREDLRQKFQTDATKNAGKPGYGKTGLPWSGAPKAPKKRGRA